MSMNLSVASEKNERLAAERGAELGALLGRLSSYGEEEIVFAGGFMYSHLPSGTVVGRGEDPRKYLMPQTINNGRFTIRRIFPCKNQSAYSLASTLEFNTVFTSASSAHWQFNLEDPNSSFFVKGNFFLSLQLSQPSGLYEARFYSTLGKMPARVKN